MFVCDKIGTSRTLIKRKVIGQRGTNDGAFRTFGFGKEDMTERIQQINEIRKSIVASTNLTVSPDFVIEFEEKLNDSVIKGCKSVFIEIIKI